METLHFAALSFYDICHRLVEDKNHISDLDKLSNVGTPLYRALIAADFLAMTDNGI